MRHVIIYPIFSLAAPRGAHASALFYSLIATAKVNGLNPLDYLKTLFENIRSCRTPEDYASLFPHNLYAK
ncbi:MAG: transposase domain-containing protein [Tatlockia sp.]|nr:transposase domain-containing protein [Tatlockia sp.]